VLQRSEGYLSSGEWLLYWKRVVSARHFDRHKRPLLFVPGFGMNAFIFGFHVQGPSLLEAAALAGHEVWTVDMRGQGAARPQLEGAAPPTMAAYAQEDLPAILGHILAHSESERDEVVGVGASLGGAVLYAYLALHEAGTCPLGAAVTIGAPLVWQEVHFTLALLAACPTLVGAVALRGWVQALSPVLGRTPLLDHYVNRRHVDPRLGPLLLQTLTFPDPALNRDLVQWVRDKRLRVSGVDVAEGLRPVTLPLLVIMANRDGVVPASAVRSVERYWGGAAPSFLQVGTAEDWYAHADLFIAPEAPTRVFAPMLAWVQAVDPVAG